MRNKRAVTTKNHNSGIGADTVIPSEQETLRPAPNSAPIRLRTANCGWSSDGMLLQAILALNLMLSGLRGLGKPNSYTTQLRHAMTIFNGTGVQQPNDITATLLAELKTRTWRLGL